MNYGQNNSLWWATNQIALDTTERHFDLLLWDKTCGTKIQSARNKKEG